MSAVNYFSRRIASRINQTLVDDYEVLYLTDEFYSPEWERGSRWKDPRFELQWPFEPTVISERNRFQLDSSS